MLLVPASPQTLVTGKPSVLLLLCQLLQEVVASEGVKHEMFVCGLEAVARRSRVKLVHGTAVDGRCVSR